MSDSESSSANFQSSPLRRADVRFSKHPRAKRYLAKVDREGNIVLTVPKRGTQRDALAFANDHRDWLFEEQQKARAALVDPKRLRGLQRGDRIWFRGERVELSIEKDWGRPLLCFAERRVYIADEDMDLRRPLKGFLKEMAKREFPALVQSYASKFGLEVKKVVIRDQKTRWGSCSTSGTISLNWRLILASESTRDYVIIHELMHMRRFDHSPEFWALVEEACPSYREHERWLKRHQEELAW
ncbi:M48 family metallopeptidase [Pelagicoccus mobilis]|uniref:M48 family metallopeptidase n=1 Tax=Pelagicoccus mobilis TaxID=415221 RepID=A0A934RT43_9BACT|nr:SprT family zinc-dependent metalloprotease [Pelagicoccus mobilis]MBK1876377.1 M48 family metallopeptidase [Pelagicoccus mobilis]